MICKQCQHQNIVSAQYCERCGAPFTEEERQAAYDATVYGKIDKWEERKSVVTLEKFTSHPIFRIAVLAVILVVGLLLGRPHGNEMTVLEGDGYTVSQHTETGDLYLLTAQEEVSVELYLPQKAEAITLIAPDGETKDVDIEKGITLPVAEQAYTFTADYGNGQETLTVFVWEATE
ncbi:MAG: zinc ribbon domain-containing protein [Clostridia bacterium]|nr:zinc ribbon domain-containing protein [Clostridia bacterium]